MSSVAVFFVFLLIMLALATLAIILDWMGKPIRRTFRPRTTGSPGWLMVDAPLPPENSLSNSAPSPDTPPLVLPAGIPAENPAEPPDIQHPKFAAGTPADPLPDHATLDPAAQQDDTPPSSGPWQAGESIYKLTPKGTPPSITAVRRRYWKNLSERRSSLVFGEENRALMAIGQAPQRFNPRTGAMEELSLPESMLRYCWATKRKPTPTWGDQGLDPFARP